MFGSLGMFRMVTYIIREYRKIWHIWDISSQVRIISRLAETFDLVPCGSSVDLSPIHEGAAKF